MYAETTLRMTRMKELKVPHDELRTSPREDTHFPLCLIAKQRSYYLFREMGKESEDVWVFLTMDEPAALRQFDVYNVFFSLFLRVANGFSTTTYATASPAFTKPG